MSEPNVRTRSDPIRKILVAVDFSECSERAADFARDFAAALGAKVGLIHVWCPAPFSPMAALVTAPGGGRETLWEHVRRQIAPELAAILPDDGGSVLARRIEWGDPASGIVDECEREGYDLIILGTHGRTGLSHLVLGSVAEKVSRLSQRPVLIVPCHR